MRIKRLVMIFSSLIILFLLCPAFSSGQTGEPKVVFKELEWNFGRIKQGEVVSHEFTFRNEGTAPLEVTRVSTSCGCAAALVSQKEIAPGGEGHIKVTFDSRGYSGKVLKYIYFDSNDPKKPQVELTVSAEVETGPSARLELDRQNLDLGVFLEGEESSGRLLIKNSGQLELKIEMEGPDFSFLVKNQPVTFPYRLPAGKSVEFEIKLPARAGRTGLIRDYILVKSNDPAAPAMSVFISRYIISKDELKKLFERYKQVINTKSP
ncbi:MAG: DUF1573 domain-containing protein [Acidobacteriota bacterium]|nr:DUF1573 domain-containing protein [Acidobacteriota bacterium]